MALSARHSPDDGSLVVAVQRGDAEAFAELFRRHYPAVHRACARRLSDPVEADEVAQAAFVRAFERIDQCAGDRRFGPWIHVIARSLCIDAFRALARVEPWEQPPVRQREQRPEGPEESLLRDERAAQLHEALASLPDRQRKAVIARDYDELAPGEIADRFGMSVGAVDSLLLRARRRLASAYRRRAGEGGGGATVLPVRSTAAAIGVALAVAPQAVLAGTGAAAHAVQEGARKAAGGVVAAVVSLAVGIAGDAAPPPAPVPVIAVAETPPPVVTITAPPVSVHQAAVPLVPPTPSQEPVGHVPDLIVPATPKETPRERVQAPETAAVAPTVVTTTTVPAVQDTAPPITRPAAPPVTTPQVTVPPLPTVAVEVPPLPVVEPVPLPSIPALG